MHGFRQDCRRGLQSDYLTGADQVIPGDWFKVTCPGEVENTVRLGGKSWFADVGL